MSGTINVEDSKKIHRSSQESTKKLSEDEE